MSPASQGRVVEEDRNYAKSKRGGVKADESFSFYVCGVNIPTL